MANFMDQAIGNVTALLKKRGMYDNTLIVFSSDNGGPIYNNGSAGANNFPLRGGKMSNWEGGVRVNAWVSGGFLPEKVRGTKEENYVCLWDWYATFSHLAGVDPTDTRAAKAGLPPIDSFNMWPLLSGQNSTGPRNEIALGTGGANDTTGVDGLIVGDWKILIGPNPQNGWTGPEYPNKTTNWDSGASIEHCAAGCLFNIKEDPTEHVNLATKNPEKLKELQARLVEIQKTVFSPNRGAVDPKACEAAVNKYGGYWGPWLE
jgi:arylsulfatase I/J